MDNQVYLTLLSDAIGWVVERIGPGYVIVLLISMAINAFFWYAFSWKDRKIRFLENKNVNLTYNYNLVTRQCLVLFGLYADIADITFEKLNRDVHKALELEQVWFPGEYERGEEQP